MIKNKSRDLILDQGRPVGPQVYDHLRHQIVHGDLLPGTAISETEISRNLSISRQPVREAFIKLSEEGLVEVRPQRGTYVTKISIAAVGDARFIREAIEADIVRLLSEQGSPDITAKLRGLVQAQKEIPPEEFDRFMELDDQFHQTLADVAGKPTAWKVIANMKAHFDRVRYLSSTQKPLQQLIDQHEKIVDAIEKQNVSMADSAIRGHLQEVLRDLPKIVALKPEMFEGQGNV